MPTQKQLMEIISIQSDIAKQGLDLAGVMALATERTLSLVGANSAAIELAEGEDMVYRATSGNAASQIGLRVKRQHSLSGLSVQSGQTLICTDSETDPRVDLEACRKVGLRSMLCMPLMHLGSPIGVLKAMSDQPGHFSDQEATLLNLLSEVISAAMYFATKFNENDLFHQATHDGLTGLANRSLFMDRLRQLTQQHERRQQHAGVLMIDMNGLKPINDNFGHRAGDAAIREFASRLKSVARQSDTVARLGGDEFGVILAPIEMENGIQAAIERIQTETASPFPFEGRELRLSASIGAARFPVEATGMDHLIELADQRMYEIKRRHHQGRR
ncbi:sensor domain-containing diguanylate cyclase [Magnetospirillum sp. 64-120]|uniref:sensor domain-containing diguanylate cyclase n=1 Tax=Magnetospirillum sp. 64-120 TaxID=1895778 RepID=UPI0009292857|nr:sensor domain-containing diguanylate cyclase [Magnetospirillum sp. 64-120]OJX75156.1 MAG: GGDEF domain-containing protein [Magnetospirillum sp. 64-120]